MRALTYTENGGPEVLHVAAVPEPHAGPGRIRVKVAAAGVNPIDWKIIGGFMPGSEAPTQATVPGFDAAGVVDEVGDGVAGVAVGDDVFGLGTGTQAELAVLTAWAPKPASLDWSVAAAAPSALETSERVLRLVGAQPGQILFVAGGAGGVGAVLVQLAVARGLTVVASAGADNQGYLTEIRAIPVLYGDGLVERVRAAAPGGVDVVVDVAGKTPAADLFALAPSHDKVISIANFDLAAEGGLVTGGNPAEQHPVEALAEGVDLLRENKIVIKVQTFPLDRAAEAYATSLSGHVRGKLVLLP
ncbi:NADP-dependent oxidoreductase [Microlunatus antarcticus]|uniref:NADPH:quinone reductase-like Zn-dependent oxidoreductase n=1 Tax=Microlunatus antarcticus TaxID=53388 RepID=A0A7W5JTI7_9ACTN|nr:NADP-dependent oxidoreductase [Microlunatus antarcticus]MBB3326071.1 NADPH:quinone reductase-like Zn-dependent oxidoreductase [Microlunatus antarcticus]